MPTETSFAWDKTPAVAAEAAAFAAAMIGRDPAYISHGEIQTGLSPDGKTWFPDLPALYAEDFSSLGDDRDLLVARDAVGVIVGVAIVAWEQSTRRRFAVLEDMVVSPDSRSGGIGREMIQRVEQHINERGIEWLFLESGLHNERAHKFFAREGFGMTGHVFAKRLE
ncbi:N-acetyltransferase [Sphingomonas sp.]|uniref:GNAT family N-acetyltransferase n=1 Tax=Sphingomonas sp. TaxID=28214 RepID=UPI000DB693BF|nr:GNAT family N-acetyltransferase [Sphingomonas sp.]PZU10841.1 MAG: hypothetical protein DI605_04215 [Sphingomonas sp.]